LQPFPASRCSRPTEIVGHVLRSAARLEARYLIRGDLSRLVLPPVAADPGRRDGLWQHTCLELFLAPESTDAYWELNLSPSGDWNAYRFRAYRTGMCLEAAYEALPFAVRRTDQELILDVAAGLLPAWSAPLRIGIAAVTEQADGLTYWALRHPAPSPDFHRCECFTITL
jgi:hypothetical protein